MIHFYYYALHESVGYINNVINLLNEDHASCKS